MFTVHRAPIPRLNNKTHVANPNCSNLKRNWKAKETRRNSFAHNEGAVDANRPSGKTESKRAPQVHKNSTKKQTHSNVCWLTALDGLPETHVEEAQGCERHLLVHHSGGSASNFAQPSQAAHDDKARHPQCCTHLLQVLEPDAIRHTELSTARHVFPCCCSMSRLRADFKRLW